MKPIVRLLLAWFIPCQFLCAWNANGHVLISRMAYERMRPQTQQWLDKMLAPEFNLDSASVWLDQLNSAKDRPLRKWHYINIPYGDAFYFPKLDPINALTVIKNAKSVVSNQSSSENEKKFAVRVLLHVIADVHQPMHTISYYSKRYPTGDKGGNLWRIKHGNLHQFWDGAGGFLKGFSRTESERLVYKKKTLYRIDKPYPFADLDPESWVKDSHQLAIDYAYFPPRNRKKWQAYQQRTQLICEQQMLKAARNMAATFDELAPKL